MIEHVTLPVGRAEYARAGTGPVVVLSHAFGPRGWGWPLALLERHCTLVALGAFNPASPSQPFTTAIDIMRMVLERLGIERFTLCAWSMAGPGAIAYAAEHPRDLEKLILVDVAGLGGPLAERGGPRREFSGPEEWASAAAAGWVHSPGPVRDLVEQLTLESSTRTPQAFARNQRANRQIRESPPPLELENIAVPSLLLAGRYSLVMGPDAAHRASERIPRAAAVVFEESAHALQLEEPERFQDLVGNFVHGRAGVTPSRPTA